jgi:hypothetical protein
VNLWLGYSDVQLLASVGSVCRLSKIHIHSRPDLSPPRIGTESLAKREGMRRNGFRPVTPVNILTEQF